MAGRQDIYNIHKQNESSSIFTSIGPKGSFEKTIVFDLIDLESSFYNLAFGDVVNGQLNDMSVSNNGDTWRILATVANEVEDFLNIHPFAIVFAKGSTPSRTRLYRMGITKYHDLIMERYTVLGYRTGNWFPFVRGDDYSAFLIFKKQ